MKELSRKQRRRLILFVVGCLTVPLLFPVGCVAYLYLSYIHDEVTEGSAYGFTIGQTKEEAYAVVGEMFHEGEIAHMSSERVRGEPFPERRRVPESSHVGRLRGVFPDWDSWTLENAAPYSVHLYWHGDALERIRLYEGPGGWRLVDRWSPSAAPALEFRVGHSYEEVYRLLLQLDEVQTGPRIRLRTGNLGVRQPVEGSREEYRFVEDLGRWKLYLDEDFWDSIKLEFEDDRLRRITRHRQNFELP